MKKIRRHYLIALLLAYTGIYMSCTRNNAVSDTVVTPILTDTMQYTSTFQISSCDEITLQYYKKMSDSRDGVVPVQAVIRDQETISRILSLLKQLPDEGDMMVKMGDVAILNIFVTNTSGSVYFTYYVDHIKTPATSFYSNHPKEEKVLYDLLMSYIIK